MALGFTDCKDLLERLTMLRFEKPGAREQEMTFAQATAFIRKALELCEQIEIDPKELGWGSVA